MFVLASAPVIETGLNPCTTFDSINARHDTAIKTFILCRDIQVYPSSTVVLKAVYYQVLYVSVIFFLNTQQWFSSRAFGDREKRKKYVPSVVKVDVRKGKVSTASASFFAILVRDVENFLFFETIHMEVILHLLLLKNMNLISSKYFINVYSCDAFIGRKRYEQRSYVTWNFLFYFDDVIRTFLRTTHTLLCAIFISSF